MRNPTASLNNLNENGVYKRNEWKNKSVER